MDRELRGQRAAGLGHLELFMTVFLRLVAWEEPGPRRAVPVVPRQGATCKPPSPLGAAVTVGVVLLCHLHITSLVGESIKTVSLPTTDPFHHQLGLLSFSTLYLLKNT